MLFGLIVGTDALRHTQSTVFKKTSEVTMTPSRWMITFVIDILPYRTLLEKLESEKKRAIDVRERVVKDHTRVNETGYLKLLFIVVVQQYERLTSQNGEMFKYLQEIDLLRKREKRAIIPLVGRRFVYSLEQLLKAT